MAYVTIPEEKRRIDNAEEISKYLAPHGIFYERWEVEGRIDPDASSEVILNEFKNEVASGKSVRLNTTKLSN